MKKLANDFTRRSVSALTILAAMILCGAAVFGQTTAFTYQGKLSDGTVAASGSHRAAVLIVRGGVWQSDAAATNDG